MRLKNEVDHIMEVQNAEYLAKLVEQDEDGKGQQIWVYLGIGYYSLVNRPVRLAAWEGLLPEELRKEKGVMEFSQ